MHTATDPEESGPSTIEVVRPHPAVRQHFARPHVGFIEDADPGTWTEPPTGLVTVILNLGEAFGGYPTGFVAGPAETYDVIESHGAIACLDLKLTPPGAYSLLGVPLEELTGSVVDMRDLFGPPAGELVEQLRSAPTWEARFDRLDAFLLARQRVSRGTDPRVALAWNRIMVAHGCVSVHDLARRIGWSKGHFIRTFRRQLGLTPKKLARIARFNHLLRDIRGGNTDWAALAATHGYCDQSHLIRDFREFTGTTPTARITAGLADPAEIRRQVNFLQSTDGRTC